MATQKERFLSYMQTCVKSTRATDSNPRFVGGNAPKEYARFLEPDRLFDYNPSKWNENLPNVEFVTYDSLYRELNLSIFTRTSGDKYAEFSSKYFDPNVVLIFDEYAFMPYGNMVLDVVDSNKTIWVSTPNEPNDILWGNGKSYGKFNRMKITGEQVFPQYRLEEFKKCLGIEVYNKEIQV